MKLSGDRSSLCTGWSYLPVISGVGKTGGRHHHQKFQASSSIQYKVTAILNSGSHSISWTQGQAVFPAPEFSVRLRLPGPSQTRSLRQ